MTLTHDLDSITATLDPLRADEVMRALPQANIAADTRWCGCTPEPIEPAKHGGEVNGAASSG